MAVEIERKFLVKSNDFIKQAYKKEKIIQAYLAKDNGLTFRVRIKNEKAFITIKGKSNKSGTTRKEWEYEIPVSDANELMKFSNSLIIEKIRYYVKSKNNLVFEVDVFEKENKGLLVAEIELESENQKFDKPDWLGKEVTQEKKYRNSQLSKNPFLEWEKNINKK